MRSVGRPKDLGCIPIGFFDDEFDELLIKILSK